MMVYDCFMFWREFECLRIRLNELRGVVDEFIIVESASTHNGQEKPLRFPGFDDPILKQVNVTYWPLMREPSTKDVQEAIRKLPPGMQTVAWARENFQRRQIQNALWENDVHVDDLVLLSDCDEIPSAASVWRAREILGAGDRRIARFDQLLCYWYLNACLEPEPQPRLCSRALRWRGGLDLQEVRFDMAGPVIEHGGWHFGWLGDAQMAREKIKAFAHQELDVEYVLVDGYLEWCRKTGKSSFASA